MTLPRRALRLLIVAGLTGAAVTITAVLPSGCTTMVNHFAFYPDREYRIDEGDLPAGVKHIRFATADGEQVEAYLLAATTRPERLVLCFHGNGGNLAHRLPELQHIAGLTGAAVLGSGYRGYGASTGRASEGGINRDGEAALRHAIDTLGYAPAQIIVIGRSLGSTVAAHLAANGPDLAGVVLVTPLSTGRDFGRTHMGAISVMAGGSFDNLRRAALISEPVLILHGTADEVVPYAHGQKVFAALAGPKHFVTIERGRHNDLEFVAPRIYWPALADFVADPTRVAATRPPE